MRRVDRSRAWIVVVAVVTFAALAMPAAAGCLKCKVKGFVAAHQRGEIEKASGYLADGFAFRVDGGDTAMNREQYLAMLAWDAAAECEVSYEDLVWEGDVVTAVFTETNRVYRLAGVEPRRYRLTFTFENEKMREQVLEPLPSEGPGLDEALRPFLAWATEHRESDLAEVYRDGQPVYTGSSAATWIALLEDWTATR